ncbi:MAG: sulfite exporter TauE/SafE family protein [Solirubrobacterales bacterium]
MVEYIAFGLLCFVVAVAGGVAGLVLGNLRLPAAVSFADTAAAGGGANVAISAVAAATAAIKHIREGRINWTMLWWLAPPSLVGGLVGGYLATTVPENALLVFISTVLFYGAWELSQWQPADKRPEPEAATSGQQDFRLATVTIGLVVGVLGGAVGLILGSLRFPALLRFTEESPQNLVGTNLAAGVVVGVAGAIGHLTAGSAGFDWQLFAVGAACSIPGAYLGAHLTGRLNTVTLVRTIAAIVLLAAIAMLAQVAF